MNAKIREAANVLLLHYCVTLPRELWLLILEFAPRRELGAPPLPAV